MYKNKFNKGVTLVSLVVTIIVLIILAGVSINAILGNNGIITIAKQSKENIQLAQMEEQTKLNELYTQIVAESGTSNCGNINNAELTQLLEKIERLEAKVTNLENISKPIDNVYPVGSIHISTDISTAEEMSNKFGGTWEQIKDTFLLSAGDTYTAGTTGGEAQHTLTIDEMPIHDGHINVNSGNYIGMFLHGDSMSSYGTTARGWDNFGHEAFPKSNNQGGGLPHNNMPPYLTVYMWKRVA